MDAKLHFSIVTVSAKYSVNLTKQVSDGFKKICLLEQLSDCFCKSIRKRKKHI